MTIRWLALFALLAQMAACGSSALAPAGAAADDASDVPDDTVTDAGVPDAAVDGEAGPDGGHCGRTHLSATVTVHLPDGSLLSCTAASADGGVGSPPPRTWVGRVTGSDAHAISVNVCASGAGNDDGGVADAGCVPSVLRVDAVAPDLDLTRFPQVWVRVKAAVSRFYACQQSLEIITTDPLDGSTPSGPSGQLLLAVVDGSGVAFADSPYQVAHAQLGCAPGRTCNGSATGADDYAFDFSRPGDTRAPARVYMGQTVTWQTAGTDFTVRNLRSFQTGNCDDYWNWAYTIYAEPK